MQPAVLVLVVAGAPSDAAELEPFRDRLPQPVEFVIGPTQAAAAMEIYRPPLVLVHAPGAYRSALGWLAQLGGGARREQSALLVSVPPQATDGMQAALDAGATDVLRLPLEPAELSARASNLVRLVRQQRLIQRVVRRRLPQLRDADLTRELQRRLEIADAKRDRHTYDHELRTAGLAQHIAEALGLDAGECQRVARGARVHDIGKLGIPEAIIRKPGRFTPEERQVMQDHPTIGYEILRDSDSPDLHCGATIALCHHEKYDGTGYPQAIGGTEIPLSARIVAVADVLDSLASVRSYRQPWSVSRSMDFIASEAGRHFDPACVRALQQRRAAVEALYPSSPGA